MDERLLAAIKQGDVQAAELLLDASPELAGSDHDGVPAVLFAVYHRQDEVARLLLRARGRAADLFEAAALGLDDRVADLLHEDPESTVTSTSPDGFTPLHLAAFFGRPAVVRRLLAAGADVDAVARNPSRVRPLNSAVAGGNEEVVEALLEAGADPEARQAGGFTPLIGAAAGGSEALVRRLLAADAKPDATSDDGKTAADFARERGHEELVSLLSGDEPP